MLEVGKWGTTCMELVRLQNRNDMCISRLHTSPHMNYICQKVKD